MVKGADWHASCPVERCGGCAPTLSPIHNGSPGTERQYVNGNEQMQHTLVRWFAVPGRRTTECTPDKSVWSWSFRLEAGTTVTKPMD